MANSAVHQLNVLVLGRAVLDDDLSRWVDNNARVEYVDTFEEALEALRTEPYDLVISRADDFIPFHNVHCSRQAAAIIDSMNQGLCIVGEDGALDWANPKMLSFSEEVRERVCRCCAETFDGARRTAEAGSSQVRGRRFSFTTQHNEHFEVTATPVIDLHHRITEVAAVVWDSTGTRRLQDKIDAIDHAGRELLSLDAKHFASLDFQKRLNLLEQKILRCTQDILHFDSFVIFLLDKKTGRLEPVMVSHIPDERAFIELYASTEGSGISGYVAAKGRSYICPDTAADPRYIRGLENAQSSLTVPLTLHDEVVGVANFESTKLAAFNEDDRQFAEIFGRYIALALNILELLVSERHTTTGQLGRNMMAEITGPLNDILTETESLVEDYIGHDDLRHRLRTISENAVRIRDTIKEMTSATPAVIGARSNNAGPRDSLLEGKRVLLVDDEEIIRETVRDVLSGYGCLVQAVDDGAAAVDLLQSEPFDLVLSDIKMPNKTGYEVFAAAKEADPNTPVILTTGFGYDPNHTIVRARREGLSAVIFKPFKVDQLLEEIRNALKPADH
jgi:two-component system, sensor histidine kinase SagS